MFGRFNNQRRRQASGPSSGAISPPSGATAAAVVSRSHSGSGKVTSAELEARLRSSRLECEQLKARLGSTSMECEKLSTQVRQVTELKTICQRLEAEMTAVRRRQKADDAYLQRISQLEQENGILKDQVTDLTQKVGALDGAVWGGEGLNGRLQKLEAENEALVRSSEKQRIQYERFVDHIAGQVVQSIIAQKSMREDCTDLRRNMHTLEQQNQYLLHIINTKLTTPPPSPAPVLHVLHNDLSAQLPPPIPPPLAPAASRQPCPLPRNQQQPQIQEPGPSIVSGGASSASSRRMRSCQTPITTSVAHSNRPVEKVLLGSSPSSSTSSNTAASSVPSSPSVSPTVSPAESQREYSQISSSIPTSTVAPLSSKSSTNLPTSQQQPNQSSNQEKMGPLPNARTSFHEDINTRSTTEGSSTSTASCSTVAINTNLADSLHEENYDDLVSTVSPSLSAQQPPDYYKIDFTDSNVTAERVTEPPSAALIKKKSSSLKANGELVGGSNCNRERSNVILGSRTLPLFYHKEQHNRRFTPPSVGGESHQTGTPPVVEEEEESVITTPVTTAITVATTATTSSSSSMLPNNHSGSFSKDDGYSSMSCDGNVASPLSSRRELSTVGEQSFIEEDGVSTLAHLPLSANVALLGVVNHTGGLLPPFSMETSVSSDVSTISGLSASSLEMTSSLTATNLNDPEDDSGSSTAIIVPKTGSTEEEKSWVRNLRQNFEAAILMRSGVTVPPAQPIQASTPTDSAEGNDDPKVMSPNKQQVVAIETEERRQSSSASDGSVGKLGRVFRDRKARYLNCRRKNEKTSSNSQLTTSKPGVSLDLETSVTRRQLITKQRLESVQVDAVYSDTELLTDKFIITSGTDSDSMVGTDDVASGSDTSLNLSNIDGPERVCDTPGRFSTASSRQSYVRTTGSSSKSKQPISNCLSPVFREHTPEEECLFSVDDQPPQQQYLVTTSDGCYGPEPPFTKGNRSRLPQTGGGEGTTLNPPHEYLLKVITPPPCLANAELVQAYNSTSLQQSCASSTNPSSPPIVVIRKQRFTRKRPGVTSNEPQLPLAGPLNKPTDKEQQQQAPSKMRPRKTIPSTTATTGNSRVPVAKVATNNNNIVAVPGSNNRGTGVGRCRPLSQPPPTRGYRSNSSGGVKGSAALVTTAPSPPPPIPPRTTSRVPMPTASVSGRRLSVPRVMTSSTNQNSTGQSRIPALSPTRAAAKRIPGQAGLRTDARPHSQHGSSSTGLMTCSATETVYDPVPEDGGAVSLIDLLTTSDLALTTGGAPPPPPNTRFREEFLRLCQPIGGSGRLDNATNFSHHQQQQKDMLSQIGQLAQTVTDIQACLNGFTPVSSPTSSLHSNGSRDLYIDDDLDTQPDIFGFEEMGGAGSVSPTSSTAAAALHEFDDTLDGYCFHGDDDVLLLPGNAVGPEEAQRFMDELECFQEPGHRI